VLEVLDEVTRPLVVEATFDEIFAGQQPILMGVEPNSFCWITGDVAANREGVTWARHFDLFPNLEHAVTDAGSGLLKGLRLSSVKREAADQPGISHSLDVFHTKHEGHRAWRVTESRLWKAQKTAEDLWRPLQKRQQQGQSIQSQTQRAHAASHEAEQLLDEAIEIETAWREVCSALEWFTPEGQRNTSSAARSKLDEWLPKLRGHEWEKTVRLLQRPESLTFLDRVEERLTKLGLAADDLETALRVEWLRRHPGLLSGASPSSGVRRAWSIATSVRLSQDASLASAVEQVRATYHQSWRASSLVEGINSVVRMQQARHRRLTPGLVNLKRVYWNCREFRTGRRKGHTPYALLGIPLPTTDWWQLLNTDPEELRKQLSDQ
jgi:predicted metal-dependent hydrolase